MTAKRRRATTATSAFGVGRRESHDSAGFYGRFRPPELSDDATVRPPLEVVEPFVCADARRMDSVDDGSVALVVTSPPYFAGKEYEEELGRGGVPRSYVDYLSLLGDVFAECKRKLEPGGRMAVNVANLGRRPFRSLAGDVTRILQDDLGLLLRAEVVWRKGEGASGSCAWGSFASPANPVLRDLTERVVIACKGRFDRALPSSVRLARGFPHEASLPHDEFMAATLDVWDIPAESARRVGHPAPFPVALPERLIRLYTYRGDLVLDPFMGSGSTLVAAARLGRRFVGYDTEPLYVELARERVKAEAGGERCADDERLERAALEHMSLRDIAETALKKAGFRISQKGLRLKAGLIVDFLAADRDGNPWYFDLNGGFTTVPGALRRVETVWQCLGRAHAMAQAGRAPLVLLASHLPRPGSDAHSALSGAAGELFFDAVELLSEEGLEILAAYAKGRRHVATARSGGRAPA